jgi:Mlc titration factor MtfA (ptsG expression regulator)
MARACGAVEARMSLDGVCCREIAYYVVAQRRRRPSGSTAFIVGACRMSLWDIITQRSADLLHHVVERLQFELPSDPVPEAWQEILTSHVPLASGLSPAERTRLLQVARLLMDEVPFEGCGGLEISDEIRVTIAATAAILLYRLPYPRFTKLIRVLVYPDTFVPVKAPSPHDLLVVQSRPALGQSWMDGMVVLSWADIQRDAANHPKNGSVILHEMAHILDAEDGLFDGTPLLDDPTQGAAWAAVLKRDFARQQAAVEANGEAPLNDYAATNHAEFFAVATESFFCDPVKLQARLPDLFDQLRLFFRRGE